MGSGGRPSSPQGTSAPAPPQERFGCRLLLLTLAALPVAVYFFTTSPRLDGSRFPALVPSVPMEDFPLVKIGSEVGILTVILYPLLLLVYAVASNVRSSGGRNLPLLLLVLLIPVFVVYVFYDGFVSIRSGSGTLELRYLWPRPALRADASLLEGIEEEEAMSGGDQVNPTWRMKIRIGGTVRKSESYSGNLPVEPIIARLTQEKHRRRIEVFTASLGPDHPSVFEAKNDLAAALLSRKRYEEAESLLQAALDDERARFGPQDPSVGTSCYWLARLHHERREMERAEPFYKRALAIRRRALDAEHPDLYDTVWAYAALLRETGREKEADRVENLVPPYTLRTDLRRKYGATEAERIFRQMMEQRARR